MRACPNLSGPPRDDELRSDDEADARGEPPPSLKPGTQLSNPRGRRARLAARVKCRRSAARGEAAYALDKHAAAVYAFTIALCATDDGVL